MLETKTNFAYLGKTLLYIGSFSTDIDSQIDRTSAVYNKTTLNVEPQKNLDQYMPKNI